MTKRNSGSELHVSAKPSPDQVRAQVDKILASRLFARSERLCRFLRFCVELTLDEKSDQLKEQLVGVEVFDRKGDYDPRTDPIVRVEARRLRSKLKAYYTSSGSARLRADRIAEGRLCAVVPHAECEPTRGQPVRPQPAVARLRLEERSIAVLPFTNLTPEADADYFSDGLTEELIHLLTRIPRLRVVAWSSMSQLARPRAGSGGHSPGAQSGHRVARQRSQDARAGAGDRPVDRHRIRQLSVVRGL